MKLTQTPSARSASRRLSASAQTLVVPNNFNRLELILSLLLGLLAFLSPKAQAQTYSTNNTWIGGGADAFWPTAGNWTNNLVPVPASLVILTNFGVTGTPGTNGSGAFGTPNIIVTNNTSVASMFVMNTNLAGASALFHTILISNGVTLTISNNPVAGQVNVLQVCSQSGAGSPSNIGTDNGVAQRIYHTIEGAGGTLAVIATNGMGTNTTFARGNIFAGQGSIGLTSNTIEDPLNAILDLSGLDTFTADVNHIVVGDGGVAGFFFNRPAGTIYFAKTNILRLWAVGNHPSGGTSANGGLLTGILAQNNGGGLARLGRFYLGTTNEIYCNSGLTLAVRGCSGWLGFNPSNTPGSSVAYFRNFAGTGRQTLWAVGNRLGAGSLANISGELDFSQGTVDALVGTLGVAVSGVANTTIGSVEFGSGIIDVNTLQLGVQSANATGPVQGTLTVSNSATLKVNTSAALGGAVGTPGASFFARLIVTNGGTATFANTAPITCGQGSSSEIFVANGSALSVFTVGTLAAPLSYLQLSGSSLTVDRGAASNPTTGGLLFVNSLDLSGANTINMLGPVLVVGQFPIIKYGSIVNGSFANLTLGSVSPGVTGFLSNNVANSSIDFVVTSSTTAVLTWDGQTNAVNVSDWDINVTPNWKGGLKYTQTAIPGSLVRFDDTAAGTTTATFTNLSLAPASLIISNNAKNYTFNGSGALTGPTALTKDGPGSLTLANTGTDAFTGGVFINDGTLQNGGAGNTLPSTAGVIIQDLPTAALDLNNLNLSVGSLSGGGGSGGNITLGTGALRINAGGATYGGVISGAGSLIKTGSGTQTLTGANTYSGGTFITNAGLVVVNGSGSGLGTGPVVISTNGVLQIGNGLADGSVATPIITNFNGTLNINPASSTLLTNVIVGSGTFIKQIGSGSTLSITNANPYTGASAVQQGILQISHPNALGAGAITVGNSTATDTYLALSGGITVTNAITLSGKTGAIVPSPVGINNVLDPISGQPGTNTLSGPITVTGSTCWSVGSDAGKLIVSGSFSTTQAGSLCEFFLRGSADGVWGSGLKDSSAALRIMLTKTDGGTWTLTGTNTFTGRTAINGGALVVDGALTGSSNVTVATAATLAGKGLITGAVTNSGNLIPGTDGTIATLTISNALYLDVVASANFDVGPTGNDQVRGLTTVVYGGNLKVTLLNPLTGNCVFKLFDATNYVGVFDSLELPDISPLTWDTSSLTVDGTIHAVGGVAVTPAITSITQSGGSFTLTGTGTLVAPFGILATTNVALPLSSWLNIGGGTFSNGVFQFTDAAAANFSQRYYLLSTPAP